MCVADLMVIMPRCPFYVASVPKCAQLFTTIYNTIYEINLMQINTSSLYLHPAQLLFQVMLFE